MSAADQPTVPVISLPPGQFAEAFPFHLAFDRELKLIQAGSTLRRLCPDVQPGAALAQTFRPLRPEGQITLAWVLDHRLRFFLLEHQSTNLKLRGQFILLPGEETLLFLGSPWFTDASEIAERGLRFEDFAIHDPVVDMLQVFQASKVALADAKKLAAKLTNQRAELRSANERLQVQDAEARKLALIAARTDNAVVLTDAAGVIVWVNEGFTRLTGYSPEEVTGKKPGTVLQGPGTDPDTVRRIGERLRHGLGFSEEILNYRKDGSSYWLSVEVQPIYDDQGKLTNFMAIETDITARRATQHSLAMKLEVSHVLTEANNLATAMPRILQAVCEHLDWHVGLLWRVTGRRLRFVDVWHPPTISVANFVSHSRSLQFDRDTGLPGRVWTTGKPVWIADLERDIDAPRSSVAGKAGLRAAFAFPVMVHGEVWGVMEFFNRNIEEPDRTLLQTFSAIGDQLGEFIVRREAEETLRATSTLQRAILEGANYAIISASPQGIIQTFNSTAERLLGYSSEELVGKLTPALFHDPAEVAARAAELSRELGRTIEPGFEAFVAKAQLGKPDEREWTYIHKDGNRFPVLLSITALFNEQNRVTGYLGVASDITVRKQAEREVKLQKTYLELLLDQSPVAVAVLDNEDRVLRINHAFSRLFGYEFSEAAGRPINNLVAPPTMREEVAQVSARGLAGERLDFETIRQAKDGSLRNVRLLGQHIVVDGKKVASLATYIDVSAQKQVEADLIKAREAAEAANRAKSEFLAVMSHEIRTPMNAVLGMTSLLLETRLDKRQSELAHAVSRSGAALLEIINDILDFSKIETGEQFEIENLAFHMPDLVNGVLQMLRPRAEDKGIGLTVAVAPEVAGTVLGDAGRLRQVLVNLVSNGIKFTDKGSVTIKARRLGSESQQVRVRFEVTDTGIGIAAANQGRLFQPFVQVDSSATRRRGGTGLGLVISKRIVERMGGTIGVDSELGRGATFWFELNLGAGLLVEAAPSEPAPPPAGLIKPPGSLRILVAEDHETNRQLVAMMLESLGYLPAFVGNGLEAVEAAENPGYEIILMDCQMPEMDGFDAAREIRRREVSRGVPASQRARIIALTANALKGDRERCLSAGMDSYLSKPFTRKELLECITAVVQAKPQEHPAATPKPVPTERILDVGRINNLCAEIGVRGVLGVVNDFTASLPARVAEIEAHAKAGRLEELARIAHSVQGVGYSLGLASFATRLLFLEQDARAGDTAAVASALGPLRRSLESALTALRQWAVEHKNK
ncbi:MAG: PAS domain S-box protein [Proteobacteria bacterium]|nr:PAS domain S-box protein [Pseudomonadota bacterium]